MLPCSLSIVIPSSFSVQLLLKLLFFSFLYHALRRDENEKIHRGNLLFSMVLVVYLLYSFLHFNRTLLSSSIDKDKQILILLITEDLRCKKNINSIIIININGINDTF